MIKTQFIYLADLKEEVRREFIRFFNLSKEDIEDYNRIPLAVISSNNNKED